MTGVKYRSICNWRWSVHQLEMKKMYIYYGILGQKGPLPSFLSFCYLFVCPYVSNKSFLFDLFCEFLCFCFMFYFLCFILFPMFYFLCLILFPMFYFMFYFLCFILFPMFYFMFYFLCFILFLMFYSLCFILCFIFYVFIFFMFYFYVLFYFYVFFSIFIFLLDNLNSLHSYFTFIR